MSQWVNTSSAFGRISKSFHWAMAFIILGMLVLGFWMVDLPFNPFKLEMYGLHKSFGIVVLALGCMRAVSRFTQIKPLALATHRKWERHLSKTIHGVLYISIFGMPLSGWLMSSAGEFLISFFGLFEMPALSGKNEALFKLMKTVHWLFACTLIVALGLHIIGALKHHVVDKDETLRRMGGRVWIGLAGLVLLLIAAALFGQTLLSNLKKGQDVPAAVSQNVQSQEEVLKTDAHSDVQKWIIDPSVSAIEFSYLQYGQKISGRFSNWSADIAFDPEILEQSSVQVLIDIASIETGSADRDAQARDEEWFSASAHPQAHFESESFEAVGANHYRVDGHLTLRGAKLPVSFPFTLDITKDEQGGTQAVMRADFVLQRLDFGVGQGQWKSTEAVEDAVNLRLSVKANGL